MFKEDEDGMHEMHITGVKVAYYFICPTKLWLFSHNISMEKDSEIVELGNILHENAYRDHREVLIDDIAIDFIRRGDGIEIHEIKKSRAMEKAHRMQVLYYIYYLKKRGINVEGVIDYPKQRRRERVILKSEDEREMERVLEDIEKVVSGPMPKPKRKKICKKCAYYEFCFGGEENEE